LRMGVRILTHTSCNALWLEQTALSYGPEIQCFRQTLFETALRFISNLCFAISLWFM